MPYDMPNCFKLCFYCVPPFTALPDFYPVFPFLELGKGDFVEGLTTLAILALALTS